MKSLYWRVLSPWLVIVVAACEATPIVQPQAITLAAFNHGAGLCDSHHFWHDFETDRPETRVSSTSYNRCDNLPYDGGTLRTTVKFVLADVGFRFIGQPYRVRRRVKWYFAGCPPGPQCTPPPVNYGETVTMIGTGTVQGPEIENRMTMISSPDADGIGWDDYEVWYEVEFLEPDDIRWDLNLEVFLEPGLLR